jgi:predicted nucleotidyltransferase
MSFLCSVFVSRVISSPRPIKNARGEQVGLWSFDVRLQDGFGAERASRRGFITVCHISNHLDELKFEGLADCQAVGISEYFLGLPPLPPDEKLKLASLYARSLGGVVQANWPVVTGGVRQSSTLPTRLVRGRAVPIAPGYENALAETDVACGTAVTIAQLQSRIEQEARACVVHNDFSRKYGVRRILTVGSTARGTYADAEVDFDLVIETEVRQNQIARNDIQKMIEDINTRIISSAEYASYCDVIRQPRGGNIPLPLHQSFFGVRGKESFVSRHQIQLGENRHHLVDFTIGNLPQLVGYELWIQRFLGRMRNTERIRICREIRLAKRLLMAMGGLYGVGVPAFRGNVVEQLVIQGWDYRCGDARDFGSLDNWLRLIAEETRGSMDHMQFAEFKSRFPLWHPGWWEPEVGFSPSQKGVNVLDLLGGGDLMLAEQQWRRVKALAISHSQICQRCSDWTISEVVKGARKMLTE